MTTPIDRRTFIQNALCCAAACMAAGAASRATAADGAPVTLDAETQNAATIHDWLTQFVIREEKNLDRAALVKLLEQRGSLCCRRLDFRRKLVADSNGDVNKLIELMGKIVGPENCTREGNTVTLVYPVDKCGCGWNPKREPVPNDPFCECSKANNQRLFEIVSGKPVKAQVSDSPRRNGKPCRFTLELA